MKSENSYFEVFQKCLQNRKISGNIVITERRTLGFLKNKLEKKTLLLSDGNRPELNKSGEIL